MNENNDQSATPLVKVLTRIEVARILGVAPKTLANWHSSGVGPPARRLNGIVRYDQAQFLAWYESMKDAA
ncbi:helix-turn-helix domain-containing protein [Arthrobacter ruber]|uniref:helix-turn-helix domain-containing protein n=1 Tax=Arthrobacter ruber TaxID=1258893 RepID=UPI000CF3B4E7|nr:helix-turn-helix domain-containing protein [Arthrobacter ruber]